MAADGKQRPENERERFAGLKIHFFVCIFYFCFYPFAVDIYNNPTLIFSSYFCFFVCLFLIHTKHSLEI